jgi:fluoroacetyl-CoA thioesterase
MHYASARCGGLGMPAGHGSIEQHRSPAIQRADRTFENPDRIPPMNHQGVSEIFFEESYTVPADQTAKSLFSRLPHGSGYAERLIECLATGYLVAVVESICIREMQQHVDAAVEVVVGRSIRIDHRGPIPPGSPLRLRGWLERLGDRSATFRVQAHDAHEIICEATVTLVAAQRAHLESRIATKVLALQCPGT